MEAMTQIVHPFLMFTGQAEQAMNFYTSLLPNSRIVDIKRYTAAGSGSVGTVMKATFVIGEQTVMCTDSPVQHNFTFTPSFSLFVSCESEEQIQRLSEALSAGGKVLMPLGHYGFSRKFTWLNDRYGVSWQLNLD
jgi:predicted 3-demethylubiquinone-9 3-methyltransferase (glyoxalase superfamily)